MPIATWRRCLCLHINKKKSAIKVTYIIELWLRFYWWCRWCCLCHFCFWWAKRPNFSSIIIIWIHAFFISRMPNNNEIGGKEYRQNKCAQWKMPVCHLHCRIMHTAVKYDTIQHHTNGMNWSTLAGAFFVCSVKKTHLACERTYTASLRLLPNSHINENFRECLPSDGQLLNSWKYKNEENKKKIQMRFTSNQIGWNTDIYLGVLKNTLTLTVIRRWNEKKTATSEKMRAHKINSGQKWI